MSLRVNLTVALKTGRGFRTITAQVDDLSFGTISPGGFDTCTVTLHRPLNVTPAEVSQFGRLYVFDGRHGGVVFEGRLQDPGRSAGNDGETYQLTAVGGSAHLLDDTRPYYIVDTELTRWDNADKTTSGATVEQIGDFNDTGVPVMILRIPQGTDVVFGSRVAAAHRGIAEAGQKIARLSYNYDCGLTSVNLEHSLFAATEGSGLGDQAYVLNFNTTSGAVSKWIGSHWFAGRNQPRIRFFYLGGTGNVNADTWWLQISGLNLLCTRFDRAGNELTLGASYPSDSVTADQVVEDLLGRVLGATVDGANATVFTTSYQIAQLAYPDGVTPAKVLEDLLGFEQGYTYHLWESNPANDKFRFEWLPWPTTVRYEADVNDGFSAPASGNTVYNQAKVRFLNRGTTRFSTRTLDVPALTDAGFTRTAFIDLGDEAATRTNADRVGDQFLAEHATPVNAGRLTVRRPILDIDTGRMVQPWEIRAGSLIRVKGLESYPNALNPNGRDGLTIFKVAATSYSAGDAAASLDLDSYAPSVARTLADLKRRPPARRR